jgi:hypothetical protein
MRNIIAFTQWSLFSIGLACIVSIALLGRYLYQDWQRITSISLAQCARAITQESNNITLEAQLQLQLQDIIEREQDLKTKADKVCSKIKVCPTK